MLEIQPLPRVTPESQGISSSKLLAFIKALDEELDEMHGLMLLRHGKVVAEGWWAPHGAQVPHMLFSLTKSFTSTAVGLAVEQGLLKVTDKVVSFFPEKAPKHISRNLAAMEVRHLLSMSTGHTVDPTGKVRGGAKSDWVKKFLSLPVPSKPGAPFVYNSLASHMLSAIVEKVSGQKLIDYLTPRLFVPLGIQPAHWDVDPQGINTGGWGLMLRTEEIARFGQLYLQKGQWNGLQLIPESWVAEATRKQVENGTDPKSDWAQGYGYQFWRCQHNNFRGDGAFGQYCIVMPDYNAVLAINSGLNDMQKPLNLVWEMLLPALKDKALAEAPAAEAKLRRKLGELAVRVPEDCKVAPLAGKLHGKVYRLEKNGLKALELQLDSDAKGVRLTLRSRDSVAQADFAYKNWKFQETSLGGPVITNTDPRPAGGHAAWVSEDTLELTLRLYTTPFVQKQILEFSGDEVKVTAKMNVGFVNEPLVLKGKVK